MKVSTILITMVVLCGAVSTAVAATDDDIARLKTDLALLIKRIEALEAEQQTLKASSQNMAGNNTRTKSSWAETVRLKGDFRYRYENIDAQGSNRRERHRIRARTLLTAKPADNLEIGIAIASGNDDPRSTNQTLGGGGSTKGLQLDQAYFKWQAKPGVTLIAGKMENTWDRIGGHGLLWDSDYTPEGFALAFDGDTLFFTVGLNFLESDTGKNDSRIMYGVQGGFNGQTSFGKLKAGVSYFDFGTKSRSVYYGKPDDFYGNSSVCTTPDTACTYANDYKELEVFAELNTQIGNMPATIFADYVRNQDAEKFNSGWASGVKLTQAGWEFAYIYQDLEADAVFGLLTDADFGGGSTDARGHVFKGGVALSKQWYLSFTYFVNERKVDTGRKEDYNRLQIDSAFKF